MTNNWTLPKSEGKEDTEQFVRWWFTQIPAGSFFEIRRSNSGRVYADYFSNPEDAIAYCKERQSEGGHWWYGVQPRKNRGGKTSDVACLRFYGNDFDHKSKGDNGTTEQAHDEAITWASNPLRCLIEDEQKEGAVIDSGNCVQVIWVHKSKELNETTKTNHASNTMLLGKRILELAPSENLFIDEVKDAARVLRLPGFANPKGGRIAKILYINNPSQPEEPDFKAIRSANLEKALEKKVGKHRRYAYFLHLAGLMASHRWPLEAAKTTLEKFNRENCEEPAPAQYIDNALSTYMTWLKTNRTVGKDEDEREEEEHLAFGWVDNRWVESIQKDGKPRLLVCKAGTFLEWEVVEKFQGNGITYAPVEIGAELLYNLPPEPVKFEDEKEIDHLIVRMASTALDLQNASKLYGGDIYTSFICPFIKHTWNYDDFNTCLNTKFLADFGSGKSAALNFVGSSCYRPILAGGLTIAVILRFCDQYRPTLVWNELELTQSTDPEIVKLINNRFQSDFIFFRADKNDGQTVHSYIVYGPTVASSRKPFADPSTESRFVSIPMAETTREDLDLFFSIRAHPDFQRLLGMLFYLRLQNKERKIRPDQDAVIKLPISARSKQKYALLMPFVPQSERDEVKAMLLKQEESESYRRAESEEGLILNAVLSIRTEADENGEEIPGVRTKDIVERTRFPRINRIMKSMGFFERRLKEAVDDGKGGTKNKTVRRWFINEIDSWKASVRRYVPFTFDKEGLKKYDSELKISLDVIPDTLKHHGKQTALEGDTGG